MRFLKNLFDRRPRVLAIIEMPEGSLQKIELKEGRPVIDRMLSVPVPISYGYIPGTLCEDGDPLDIFVVSGKYLNTCDVVSVRVIGIFECLDQGLGDDKVLAIVEGEECSELKIMAQVANYLLNYKPGFVIKGWKEIKSKKDLEKYNK